MGKGVVQLLKGRTQFISLRVINDRNITAEGVACTAAGEVAYCRIVDKRAGVLITFPSSLVRLGL